MTDSRTLWLETLLGYDPDIQVQFSPKGRWSRLALFPKSTWSGVIRRTLARGELVFDLDGGSWEAVRPLAHELEETCRVMAAPFLRFSSGRWLHYSLFLDPATTVPFEIIQDSAVRMGNPTFSIDDVQEVLRQIRIGIFRFAVNLCYSENKPKGSHFDLGMNTSRRHMIRVEGAVNERTGYHKSLLRELPKRQPAIPKSEVTYPQALSFWRPPEGLIRKVYMEYVIPKFYQAKKPPARAEWIEKLLRSTVPDGRERIVSLVLIPYLLGRGVGEDAVVSRVMDWLERCYAQHPPTRRLSVQNIRSKVRYSSRNQRVPLSLMRAKQEILGEAV